MRSCQSSHTPSGAFQLSSAPDAIFVFHTAAESYTSCCSVTHSSLGSASCLSCKFSSCNVSVCIESTNVCADVCSVHDGFVSDAERHLPSSLTWSKAAVCCACDVPCNSKQVLVQVMGNGGCPTSRSVLAYKLRAADNAVIDTYPATSKHHKDLSSRYILFNAAHSLHKCHACACYLHVHAAPS